MKITNQSQLPFENINIIGLGLIGGSIAKSCRAFLSQKITGFDIDKKTIDLALDQKIIDEKYNFSSPSNQSDLTIIASPLSKYQEIFQQLNHQKNQEIIIDIGSLKTYAIDLAANYLLPNSDNFIACHPIAGSDKSGISYASADLFLDKKVFITPTSNNQSKQIKKVQLFWEKIGSRVEFIDAKAHDQIFALVSHLPQFLAFIAKENNLENDRKIIQQHLRLQNSNPQIWQEIFTLNCENIQYYLQFYKHNLQEAIEKITNGQLDIFLDSYLRKNAKIDGNKSFEAIAKQVGIDDLLMQRIILVLCFLNLPDIDKFKSSAGSGFKDFTAIINQPKIHLKYNPQSLIQFLNQIKLKIINYEFK